MKSLIILTLALFIQVGYSQQEAVGVGQQGKVQLEVPKTGMTMDSVKDAFGDPKQIISAVGEPPITRWVYDDFTVYFEADRVIHAVKKRQ
ncbi:MAG: hypothetical protein V2I33_08630 [Kangiellaceae bacterium]|jgi:hypothetical protein|nr:hypothetical protein [Kangiellaceae bacterium]